ncbi:hypothetical protein ACFL6U_13445 [Planctomycetota bacterium]
MKTPNIVMLRSKLTACRLSGLAVYLAGFSGIIVAISCYQLYRYTPIMLSYHIPLQLLILGAVLIWLLSGFPSQIHLIKDRAWIRFTNLMPVSPWHTLALHIHASLLPTILVALSIPCMTAGGGLSWWTPTSVIRWIVFAFALLWCWFLDLALIMTVSRYQKGLLFLQGILLAWGMTSIMRIGILWGGSPDTILHLPDLLLGDWGLRILGVSGFVRTMTAPNNDIARIGLFTLGHLGSITTVLFGYTWFHIQRRPIERQDSALAVVLSWPAKQIIQRLLPGGLGGQICIECLRMLRSTSEMFIFYNIVMLGIVLVDRLCGNGGELGAMALILGSMVLATDTAVYVLGGQRGKELYDVYGTNTQYYLLGFTGSLGILIALFCVVQIPLLGALDWHLAVTVFCACTASSIILTDFGLVTNRRLKQAGYASKLIEGTVCGVVILIATVIIWLLSIIHFSIPLLVAGSVLYLRARNTERGIVKKLYWDM